MNMEYESPSAMKVSRVHCGSIQAACYLKCRDVEADCGTLQLLSNVYCCATITTTKVQQLHERWHQVQA